jgi:hypothetical protein
MLRVAARGAIAALFLLCGGASATEYFYVPSLDYPSLDSAVAAAALSADAENVIYIRESPILVAATITLTGADFHCGRKLALRPDPGIPTLRRATIASTGFSYIFNLSGCACVTFQDLDIVRHITNAFDLIQMVGASHIVMERCRIGLDWSAPGAAGFAYLRIQYPTDVVIRNCFFFSNVPGDMDYGITAANFGDPANSLYLYNNVVSDYQVRGVDITGAAVAGPLLVMRNNVVANHPSLLAEPLAFRSDVNLNMIVEASHNAVFASAGFGELVAGAQSISGFPGGTVVRLARVDVGASFVDFSWNHIPEWDPNLNFYRLVLGGPLHLAPPGVTVGDGIPYVRDIAVRDDWEKEARPGGVPNPHTDRGADQIEAGLATSVDDRDAAGSTVALWAAPLRNPAGGAAALQVRSAWEGRLELELYDVAGRLVHRSMREVPSRWQGVLEWPRGNVSGALFYRVQLSGRDGMREEVRGRITIVR